MVPEETKDMLHKIEGQLALARSKQRMEINSAIPTWPEKLSWVFALGFLMMLLELPLQALFAKLLLAITFCGFYSCHWYSISSLQTKVNALMEVVKNDKIS